MKSRLGVAILLCGLLFLIEGCGTVYGPSLPFGKGKFSVVVKGDKRSLETFAAEAEHTTCTRIRPSPEEKALPEEKLIYQCFSPTVAAEDRLGVFGKAYATALSGQKTEGRLPGIRMTSTATSEQAADEALPRVTMTVSTNGACFSSTCNLGTMKKWLYYCGNPCPWP
jgi:hypothetical protein